MLAGAARARVSITAGDAGEAACARQERLDRDLVGGVQHRRRGAAGAQRVVGKAPGRESAARSGRSNARRFRPDEVERLRRPSRCARARPARSAIGVRMSGCRAARAPSRRRTRPANGSTLCGWITHLDALGRQRRTASAPRSLRGPCSSCVAESTEILRPITQFGCAHACSGVTCVELLERRGAERAARGGEQDAAHAGRSVACCRPAALEDRVVLAVDRQQLRAAVARRRRMNSAPAMTSASLLASSTRLPARAAASVGGRPAAPTIAAMTVSHLGHAWRPRSSAARAARAPRWSSLARSASRSASAARRSRDSTA